MRTAAGLWVCSCVVALGLRGAALGYQARGTDLARAGVCVRQGSEIVGVIPVRIDRRLRQPKKVRNVAPNYPELPPRTRGSGSWMGELLLSAEGKVVKVWAVREVWFSPPFPSFNQAIVAAIGQWEFEPLVLDSRPVPACTTVTVTIDWP
jgi:hypothetical protein